MIGELHEWDELLRNAHERYKEPPLDKLAKETAKLTKTVEKAVSKWTAFGGGLHIRSDADLEAERTGWFEELEGDGSADEIQAVAEDDRESTPVMTEAGRAEGDVSAPIPQAEAPQSPDT